MEISEYLGSVFGDAVKGGAAFMDLFASISDVVGGRSSPTKKNSQA